jgi:hypothetical protein
VRMYITVCNFHNSALSLISAHNDSGHVDCWLPDMKLERSQPHTIVNICRTNIFFVFLHDIRYPMSHLVQKRRIEGEVLPSILHI